MDSEGALGELVGAGHEVVTDQSHADVIIVNTCGFIESAQQESIEAIDQALEYKKSGSCKAVVVIGCLSQRFGDELRDEMPEIDALLGVEHAGKIAEVIDRTLSGEKTHAVTCPTMQWVEPSAKVQSTPPWTAYVKVSDGCSNRCAYCAIPDIRGPHRSRPQHLIVDEAKRLSDAGVKEIVLIGQDLTQYGEDKNEPNALAKLISKLNRIEALRWIRLMYCYPTKVTPELIDAIANCERVVKYIDLPLQHADADVLKAMNRRGNAEQYAKVIGDLRAACPEIAIRTTFIVGFPGETEAAFGKLMEFVENTRFDRVGAFIYSREQGTPAASLGKRVPRKVAAARYDRLMRLQQGISIERNRRFIGEKIDVLVEGATEDGMFGRSYRDAPDIDGIVYLPASQAKPGEFVRAKIADVTEYDLIAAS